MTFFSPVSHVSSDIEDPAIAHQVTLEPGVRYVLSLVNSPKIPDLTRSLLYDLERTHAQPMRAINIVPNILDGGDFVLVNSVLKRHLVNGGDVQSKANLDYSEMHCQVSSSVTVQNLVSKLLQHQERVPVILFKNTLELKIGEWDSRIDLLAPRADLVDFFDNKLNQRRSFVNKLDLPVPRGFEASTIDNLLQLYRQNFSGPAFVTASHGVAGSGTTPVYSEADIYTSPKLRTASGFVISDLLNVTDSPSTLGLISDREVRIIGLSDQLLDGVHYLGNVAPTRVSITQAEEILHYSTGIGRYLQSEGYRGPFGVDFMIHDGNKVYFTELNPRFIGASPELNRAYSLDYPDSPSIPGLLYNSFIDGDFGSPCVDLPQTPWASRTVKARLGQITRSLPPNDNAYVTVLNHPGGGVFFLNDGPVARIVYRDNPGATRENMITALDEREKDIKFF